MHAETSALLIWVESNLLFGFFALPNSRILLNGTTHSALTCDSYIVSLLYGFLFLIAFQFILDHRLGFQVINFPELLSKQFDDLV